MRAIGKMFLVLVLLFGGPGAAPRERARRPAVAMVVPLGRGADGAERTWPEPWPPAPPPHGDGSPEPGGRHYIPVRAA